MGFFNKEKLSKAATALKKAAPGNMYDSILKSMSGVGIERTTGFNLYYQFIGFKGIKDGVGCSTLVANTAVALAKLGLHVCVLDTSILYPCQNDLLRAKFPTLNRIILDKQN